MRFYIHSYGDNSVGLEGISCHVSLPNDMGIDDGDWREMCEEVLKDLYGSEQIVTIHSPIGAIDRETLEEVYRYYLNNYLTIEKFNAVEMPYLTQSECESFINICKKVEKNL